MALPRNAHSLLAFILVLAMGLAACGFAVPTELQPPIEEPQEEVIEETETHTPTPTPGPSETPTPTDTAEPTETATETPTPTPTDEIDPFAFLRTFTGTIDAQTDIIWDVANHFGFILLPELFNLSVQRSSDELDTAYIFGEEGAWLRTEGGFYMIETGQVVPDLNSFRGLFQATGQGTVAGFPDVTVTLIGDLSQNGIDAFARYGAGGELPQGRSALYRVSGPWQEPVGPEIAAETFDEFLSTLIESLRKGDQQALLLMTDPFALALYGIPQCQEFLAARPTDPAEDIVPSGQIEVGDVPLTLDGVNVEFANVFQVPVNHTRLGATTPTTMYFRLVGSHMAWELDCGDPLK